MLVVVAAQPSAATASEHAVPRKGGAIVIASQEQTCLNMLLRACRSGGISLLPAIKQVLGGAFEVTSDLTYRPNLVSRYEVATKPFTVTYHIRPEAVWSDGRPVSARDFEFTWRATRRRDAFGAPHSVIRRVVPLDTKTVKVIFRGRVADWKAFFWIVLPRHALIGENLDAVWSDTIDNPKTRLSIGSGPFLVQRWERGRQLTLVRNRRYWGPHRAYLGRLVFRFLPEAEYADELRGGGVDVIPAVTAVARNAVLALRHQPIPGATVASGPGTFWSHLELRIGPGGHPALKSGLVRRALAYGVDRRAIALAVLGGLDGEADAGTQVLESVVFLRQSPFYRPNWAHYRRRPAEARRLLEEAGCGRGADGIYVCSGERLSLRFVTTAGVETRKLTLDLIRSQLGRVGVEVEEVFVSAAFFNTVLPDGNFDVALFNWESGPSLWDPYWTFACGADQNYTGYCRRGVTHDLVQSTRTLDVAKRIEALNRIDVRLAKDVPAIPLFQSPSLAATRKSVHGVDPTSLASVTMDWNARDWWLAP
jgi:peptide/nickel transport system substrate-binding protein